MLLVSLIIRYLINVYSVLKTSAGICIRMLKVLPEDYLSVLDGTL